VAEDLTAAVLADGSELLNCALKTVENVVNAGGYDLKRQVVVIPAHFAPGHGALLRTVAAHALSLLEHCLLDSECASSLCLDFPSVLVVLKSENARFYDGRDGWSGKSLSL
jgi:hypothetical protein